MRGGSCNRSSYDRWDAKCAVMVRRSSGEQGIAIQELIKRGKANIVLPRAAKGHTPLEVAAGALLGVVLGLIVATAHLA